MSTRSGIWSHPTIGSTLFFAFTLISVPPILLLGAWLRNQRSHEAITRFDEAALLYSQSIEEGVREFISLKKEVLDVTAGTLSALTQWETQFLQELTDAQIKSSKSFDSFYVGDMTGTSLVFAPSKRSDGSVTISGVSYRDRDYFQKLQQNKRVAFGTMKLGKQSGVANIHIAVPIYADLDLKEQGDLRGYITAGIKPELVQQVITRILHGEDELRALLVEVDHRVIADSTHDLPIYTQLPISSIYTQPCNDSQGQTGFDLERQSIRAVCVNIHFETIRWTLWITSPTTTIQAEAERSTSLTIYVSGLLLLAVLLVAAILSLWISKLVKLISDNAQRVGDGEFEINLPNVTWFTPKEIVEVGKISLQTLARLRESKEQVGELIDNLEQANQRQAPLVEAWKQVSEAIEILGSTGETLFVNPAFYELIGEQENQDQWIGVKSTLFDLIDPQFEGRPVGEVILSHASSGLSWSGEVEAAVRSKRRIHEVHSSPIFDAQGALSRVVVIRRDLTEERIAQASAAHNDRLAAVGTLAAGMAHEINNPLTYIKMSLELIDEGLEDTQTLNEDTFEELREAARDAAEGVDRVSHIVRGLLSIARSGGERGQSERATLVDLVEIIQTCSSLVKADFSKQRVKLELDLPSTALMWGRRSELLQVFLNFIMNAAQAMPKDRQTPNWVKVEVNAESNQSVITRISDNGSGIPKQDQEKIFEPFFSSKPVGEGTGLGLAVSRGIIEAHHGKIALDSDLDVGTTFTLIFPTAAPSEENETKKTTTLVGHPKPVLGELTSPVFTPLGFNLSPASVQQPIKRTHRWRILIIDDDPLVAKSLGKMLRQEEVAVALRGIDALELLASNEYDIILSDVMMPEIDGPTLYNRVRELFPQYQERYVFITGAAKGSDVANAVRATGRVVLSKPITRQQLLFALEEVLSEGLA